MGSMPDGLLQFGEEFPCSRNEFEDHVALEIIDHIYDESAVCLRVISEIFAQNLHKGLAFYYMTEAIYICEFLARIVPESGILSLSVHQDTVKVEQCYQILKRHL